MNRLNMLNSSVMGWTPSGPVCRLKLSERIAVRVPLHIARVLETMATSAGLSQSDLVRQLIIEAMRARFEAEVRCRPEVLADQTGEEIVQ